MGIEAGAATALPEATTVQWVQVENQPGSKEGEGEESINLGEIWRAIQRRKRLIALTAGVLFAFSVASTINERIHSPVFQGSFDLLINDPLSDGSNSNSGDSIFAQLAQNTPSADIPTLIEVLSSPVLLDPVARQFGTTGRALSGRISIDGGGKKDAGGVLTVSITGDDPIQDQKVLEALSQAYLGYSLAQRQQRLSEGLRFLDRQAPALEQKTNQLQAQLARFREANNLLQPTEEGGALKAQLAGLENQRAELKADRSRLISVRGSIQNGSLTAQGFQEAISTSTSTSGGGGLSVAGSGQALLQELTKVEQQLAEAQAKFTPSSTMVRGLLARRDGMVPLLRRNQLEAVSAALTLNANRLQSLETQIARLTANFQRQPALIKQFEDLQQRLQIAQQNQSGIIQARENFQLEIAQRSVPWNVISAPRVSSVPVKPSVSRNLVLGFGLSLLGGVAVGLIRDRFDHVFHHASEVRDDLKQPLLGQVPYIALLKDGPANRPFRLAEFDRSLAPQTAARPNDQRRSLGDQRIYQEAFRNLYTSLRFLNTDRPLRSIAITSSEPKEGKTLVTILLARTLSAMGQRVLLVDADLRQPQLHQRLGLDNQVGLSNLLSDEDARWQDALQPVPGHSNWLALTSGRRPPDPARLIGSHRMTDLVRELAGSGQFDLILYDTPPMLGLADSLLLAEQLDGMVLLVSLGRVDRSLPHEAIERIRSAGAPLLGILTNATKKQKHSKDYYPAAYTTDDTDPDDDQSADPALAAAPKPGGRALARKVIGWLDQ
jgi:polysaccharide biosynthesis transport protein